MDGLQTHAHTLLYVWCFYYYYTVRRSWPVNTANVRKNYPAEDAVGLIAEFTVELIDVVLVDAPPSTVGSLAVEAVLRAAFCDAQTQLQKALVLLF